MFSDVLGQLMQAGMTGSGNNRVRHALGPQGLGQAGNPLAALLGGGAGGGAGNLLDQLLGGVDGPSSGGGLGGVMSGLAEGARSMLGGATQSVHSGNPLAIGGLGALAGALLGGGGGAAKGAVGGGALALLGTLAVSALKGWGRDGASADAEELAREAPLGLREPQNAAERDELEQNAALMLRAMISAAKADGQVDRVEMERIAGKLQEGGIDQQERAFVEQEMRKPLDVDELARDARTPQQAVEVYAASLLAIEVDTEAERRYLGQLANRLGLQAQTVQRVHQMLGVA